MMDWNHRCNILLLLYSGELRRSGSGLELKGKGLDSMMSSSARLKRNQIHQPWGEEALIDSISADV
jgi:hypothetical protein